MNRDRCIIESFNSINNSFHFLKHYSGSDYHGRAMKRNRIDGQVSRQEYDEDYDEPAQQPGSFSRATPNTLAGRKFISAQRGDKKFEFAKHIKALNSTFHAWFTSQVKNDAGADLQDGVQDYIDYVSQLEDRYLRSYGEVLTFGSGDCG